MVSLDEDMGDPEAEVNLDWDAKPPSEIETTQDGKLVKVRFS